MADKLTRPVAEGESLEEFLLRCARHYVGIPYYGYFNIQDFDEQIEETLKELDYYSRMSVQEAKELLEEDYTYLLDQYNNYVAEKKELEKRYMEMKKKVEAWEPPAPEFEPIKSLALKKLKESIETDCVIAIEPPKRQDPEEWLRTRIESIKQHLDWLQRERNDRIEKIEIAIKWMETLKRSLGEIE